MSHANDRMRAQLDQLVEQYDAARRSLADAHGKVREVNGRAQSPDRLITAVVSARGALRELRLNPKVYRKLAPSQLAGAIVNVVREAAADASAQVGAVLRPMLPPGVDADDIVHGQPASQPWAATITGASLDEWWSAIGMARP